MLVYMACVARVAHVYPPINTKTTPAMISKNKRSYEPEALPPSVRLRRNLGDLVSRNELASNRIGEIVNDIHRVAPTELRDLTGTAGKHTARRLRGKFMKKSTWMPDYIASVRCWNPKTQKIERDQVPMQAVHEVVAVLLKHGFADKLLETGNMDPLTLEHLRHCELEAGCKLLGLGIWGDGAPTQWDRNESIDVISLSLPGIKDYSTLRIPLIVLPHSRTCSETWEDVFEVVKWSLTILASGRWPTSRHDGSPWLPSDKCRMNARPLLRAALTEVRQDWKFAAEVFGFPAHNLGEGNCWECTCTPGEVIGCQLLYLHILGAVDSFAWIYIYIYIYKCIIYVSMYNICIYV